MTGGTARAADGRTLAWVEYGDPSGIPAISHHGTPGSRLNRHPDASFYERHRVRLISYDRPGYGGSDPQADRTVADAADDVRVVADELGLERFAVIGASGGGPHALACAARLGDRVTRVAVVVGVGPSDDPALDFLGGMSPGNVEEFNAARAGRETLEPLLASYVEGAAEDPLAPFDAVAHELPEPDRATLRREDVREVLRESMREALSRGLDGWVDDDLAFAQPWGFSLADVRVPVRLWQGDLDVLVPREHARYLASKLPDAEFELIPNAGHLLFDELAAVYDWLTAG